MFDKNCQPSIKMRIFYNFGKLLILLLIVWLAILVFLLGGPLSRSSEDDLLTKKLAELQNENRALVRERDKLTRQIRDLKRPLSEQEDKTGSEEEPDVKFTGSSNCEPSLDYELFRRRAIRDTKELLNFVQSQLNKISKSRDKLSEGTIEYIKSETLNHAHAVLADLQQMKENDGYEEWRRQEAEDLSDVVQQRLFKLQNPADCNSAQKLLCNLNKGKIFKKSLF